MINKHFYKITNIKIPISLYLEFGYKLQIKRKILKISGKISNYLINQRNIFYSITITLIVINLDFLR